MVNYEINPNKIYHIYTSHKVSTLVKVPYPIIQIINPAKPLVSDFQKHKNDNYFVLNARMLHYDLGPNLHIICQTPNGEKLYILIQTEVVKEIDANHYVEFTINNNNKNTTAISNLRANELYRIFSSRSFMINLKPDSYESPKINKLIYTNEPSLINQFLCIEYTVRNPLPVDMDSIKIRVNDTRLFSNSTPKVYYPYKSYKLESSQFIKMLTIFKLPTFISQLKLYLEIGDLSVEKEVDFYKDTLNNVFPIIIN